MGTLGDIKDIGILALVGAGAYLLFKFLKDPGAPVKAIIETNLAIREDIIERRDEFGYVPGTISPGWLGEPPTGSAGMRVYADKFASYFGLTPATVNSNDAGGAGVR